MGITEPRATDLPPPPPPRPTHLLSRWLFLRLLGVIYFIAFVSLALQITGLVGEPGIPPARTFLVSAPPCAGPSATRGAASPGADALARVVAAVPPDVPRRNHQARERRPDVA